MQTKTVSLSVPLAVGAEKISTLTLRRPKGGDLRGIKLTDLLSLDFGSVAAVALRTSLTPLPRDAFDALDPADVVPLGVAVLGFFEASDEPSPTMQ